MAKYEYIVNIRYTSNRYVSSVKLSCCHRIPCTFFHHNFKILNGQQMALTYYLSMFISTIIENNNGGIQKLVRWKFGIYFPTNSRVDSITFETPYTCKVIKIVCQMDKKGLTDFTSLINKTKLDVKNSRLLSYVQTILRKGK